MKGGKKTPPYIPDQRVVPGRVELPTSTLSVWRSNQLSYRTSSAGARNLQHIRKEQEDKQQIKQARKCKETYERPYEQPLQKGGVPAAPSGTATLLRLSPNHRSCPRALLAVTHFRYSRLSWLDGRCVQGPGTYSPRHG